MLANIEGWLLLSHHGFTHINRVVECEIPGCISFWLGSRVITTPYDKQYGVARGIGAWHFGAIESWRSYLPQQIMTVVV